MENPKTLQEKLEEVAQSPERGDSVYRVQDGNEFHLFVCDTDGENVYVVETGTIFYMPEQTTLTRDAFAEKIMGLQGVVMVDSKPNLKLPTKKDFKETGLCEAITRVIDDMKAAVFN